MDLKWDYENKTVTVGMKEYNEKAMKEAGHTKPEKPVDGSTQYTKPEYGKNYNMLKMITRPFFLQKTLR